ncbi:MAG TPA: hypothetical protein DDY68_03785, partial [Porphyromonadaceae bacterium]|nr:hypothetical protein [Porphyromonadaceae bacterium]
IESSFIPFPSEVVVPPAAYKAASGELNVFLVVLFSTLGANFGALINYFLSLWVGRPVVHWFANSRLGHMLLLSKEGVENAEDFFRKHGSISTFVGRLIPAIRQLISIPAGLSKMKLSTFLLYTTLGAGIWNGVLALIGWYLHSVVPKEELMEKVSIYNREISIVVCILVGLGICFVLYKAFSKREKK